MGQLSSFSYRTNAAYLQSIREGQLWRARVKKNPVEARRIAHNTALEQKRNDIAAASQIALARLFEAAGDFTGALQACWDAIGKALQQPIYNLLGGKCREKVRACANGWYRCPRVPAVRENSKPDAL